MSEQQRSEPGAAPLPGEPLHDQAPVSASIDPPDAPGIPSDAAGVPGVHPALSVPAIVRPTEDVALAAAAPRVPGTPAPDYGRLPTAPVATMAFGPSEDPARQWTQEEAAPTRAAVAPWALGLAIAALAASLAVGWMLPLGLAAIIVGVVAARRPLERRGVVVWAIVLGALSVLYSSGWLLWAAWRAGIIG